MIKVKSGEQILEEYDSHAYSEFSGNRVILEVLLDIRDLLLKKA